jgi:lipoic acid synthetase
MVGMGESSAEVSEMLADLRRAEVDIVTIGQYLPPSEEHWPLDRYASPKEFSGWAALAIDMGFKGVASAPLVRSSYRAGELAREAAAPTAAAQHEGVATACSDASD